MNKKLYNTWYYIKLRTQDPLNPCYNRYGDRGIFLFEEWNDCNKFISYIESNLGKKPSKEYTLERIDNNKGYVPNNLKWANPEEQAKNRSKNINAIKKDNFLNKRFGSRTVIEWIDINNTNLLEDIKIRVICDCGNDKIIKLRGFKKTLHCEKCNGNGKEEKDFINKKLGKRTIIEWLELKNNARMVKVKCDCGREDIVPLGRLIENQGLECKECSAKQGGISNKERNWILKQLGII